VASDVPPGVTPPRRRGRCLSAPPPSMRVGPWEGLVLFLLAPILLTSWGTKGEEHAHLEVLPQGEQPSVNCPDESFGLVGAV
jgi:hypothetical protein